MKERGFRPCEAPEHAEGCDGHGTTRDHFTPKCIAKLYGWSQEQIESDENRQYLSKPCHIEKDRDTPLRRDVLLRQMQGLSLNFYEHTDIFLNGNRGIIYESRKAKKRRRKHKAS